MTTFILGSSNPQGNTNTFATICCEAASGRLVDISDFQISPWDYSASNLDDDFIKLVEMMLQSNDIVFCTPVYWYSMSCQMKTFFDRFSDLISRRKELGRALAGKRTWLLTVGNEPTLPEGFEVPFRRTSEYLNMQYIGAIYGCSDGDQFSIYDQDQAKALGTSIASSSQHSAR